MIAIGRKGQYADWLTDDGLLRIEGWARSGLTDAQIAHNIGINVATLYKWQNQFNEISNALKRGKRPVDDEVENALLKSALGFEFEETVTEITEGMDGSQRKTIKRYKRYSPPSTTAQIFWLKNRRPDKWRDKPITAEDTSTIEKLDAMLAEVRSHAANTKTS